MKLVDAIRIGEKLLKEPTKVAPLEGRIAMTVLVRFARRVVDARDPLRSLQRAVLGEDELNQEDLFPSDAPKGTGP